MTVLESIQNNPVFSSLSEEYITMRINSRDIDETAVCNIDVPTDLYELILADLYYDCCVFPEYKEGSLVVKMDTALLLKRAEGIYRKYNDPKLKEIAPEETVKGYTKINLGVKFS